jgi:hypothetical protein
MFTDKVQAELRRRCRNLFQGEDTGPGLRVVAVSGIEASSRAADDAKPHPLGVAAGPARFGYARCRDLD